MRTYAEIIADDIYTIMPRETFICVITELSIYAPRVFALQDKGTSPETLCAYIYDLYQDYRIHEKTEEILYDLADPKEKIASPSECEYEGPNLLLA